MYWFNDLGKSQNFELNTQRTLGILDNEFNSNNKFTGKQTKANGLFLGTITSEQFARLGQSAIEEDITKRCTIDHQQSQLQCFVITSYNLAGCYDTIVHNAVTLALLHSGVSHSRIKSIYVIIQNFIHRIPTAFVTQTSSMEVKTLVVEKLFLMSLTRQ